MTPRWAKFPSDWIVHQKQLTGFPMQGLGESIAALKLYAAIAGVAGASTTKGKSPSGAALLSYGDLIRRTGLSRALVSRGLGRLTAIVDITPGRGRTPSKYILRDFPEPGAGGWAMLPVRRLAEKRTLALLSVRSSSVLASLKLYFVFLALRNNGTGLARVSYERIHTYTQLPRRQISKGISTLVSCDLVSVRSPEDAAGGRSNEYRVLGLPGPGRGARQLRG